MDSHAGISGQIRVTLHYAPLGPVPVDRRQLRLDGFFVETGPFTLPPQSEVEVTLAISRGDQCQIHTLNARVVGRSRRGTNLAFQQCSREIYHALREAVAHEPH